MNDRNQKDHQISIDIVERVSRLAKITISEEEHDTYVDSIDSILHMLHQLDELDLSTVKVQESKALMIDQARTDVTQNADFTEYMADHLAQFDDESSLFQVPEFIDQD